MDDHFPNCGAALQALDAGLSQEVCHDFRAIREVVGCDVWHRLLEQDVQREGSFSLANLSTETKRAWANVRTACAAHGGTKPEYGFLEGGVLGEY